MIDFIEWWISCENVYWDCFWFYLRCESYILCEYNFFCIKWFERNRWENFGVNGV